VSPSPQTSEEKLARLQNMYDNGWIDYWDFYRGCFAVYMGLKPVEYMCGASVPEDDNVVRIDFENRRRA
jgi:hypothetical protein